jgi:Tfp pilus assembly protein PilZ
LDSHDGLIYSVRFSKLKTADENVFEQLLEFLADSGDDTGQRKNVRLTQRIDIQYDDINELQATLEDISAGGLGITVPEPMELNQSLLAVISTTDESCQLVLRARVVRQQELESSNIKLFRVGLEFEHPTEDLKDRIKKLIQTMASANPANKFEIL